MSGVQVVIAAGHKVPRDALLSLCPHHHHKTASLHDDDVEYSSAGVPLSLLLLHMFRRFVHLHRIRYMFASASSL